MCVIIDSCCLPCVFNDKDKCHPAFAPIARWINEGTGKIIIGGSKYREELGKLASYLPIISELDKKRRVVKIPDDLVDALAAKLKLARPEAAFNDEHLVALVITSRCAIICTNDKIAMPYLKLAEFYKKPVKRPSIYKSRSHASMCCDKNLVSVCRQAV